jgi:tetratricopeptide (TPR) repeat protein
MQDRGNELYKSKQFEEALAAYDEAIALDNTNMTVWHKIRYVLSKRFVYSSASLIQLGAVSFEQSSSLHGNE